MEEIYIKYAGHGLPESRIRESLEEYPSVAAWRGADLVGFAYTLSFAPDIVELGNIYISEEQRGAGIGREMLAFIERAMMPPKRYIIAVNNMARSLKQDRRDPAGFYQRIGYSIISETESSKVFWKKI